MFFFPNHSDISRPVLMPLTKNCGNEFVLAQDYFNGYRADIHQHSNEQFRQFHGQNTNSTADKKEIDIYRGISDLNIVSENPRREPETEDYNYRRARSKRKAGDSDESKKKPSKERGESDKSEKGPSGEPGDSDESKKKPSKERDDDDSKKPETPPVAGGLKSRLPPYAGPNLLPRPKAHSFPVLKRFTRPRAPSFVSRPRTPSDTNLKMFPRPRRPFFPDLKRLSRPRPPSFSHLKRIPRPRPRPRPSPIKMPLEPEMLPGPLSPSDYGKRRREMRRRPEQKGKLFHKFEMHHNIRTKIAPKNIPHRLQIKKKIIQSYVPNKMVPAIVTNTQRKLVPAVRPVIQIRPVQVGIVPVLTEQDFQREPVALDTRNSTATRIKILLKRIKTLFVAGLNMTKELKKTLFVNSELNHNLCLREIQELEQIVGHAPGDNQPTLVEGIQQEEKRLQQSISNRIFIL
ncbi:hypothetical protein TNIN_289481 [Trichonephila inaurata madagascariensis]|uniref:Uncharacterized protein n=1 Tax=Trichonephila inaurata madagascariensis TaxID=2747483 RepID=A0A8X6JYV4_9ARAC|nr:hypothetical protein TNIN_289481 [Trichonephila inaurata madagascariensis]